MRKEIWLGFEWPGVHILQGYPSAKAWWYDFPRFGCPLSKKALTFSKGTMSYYVIRDEYEGLGKKFFEKVKIEPEIMLKVLREVDEAAEAIFAFEKKWRGVDFRRLSDRGILQFHGQLFHWDEILWRKGQIQNLLELHNNFLSTYIRGLIRKNFGSKKEAKYFQILSAGEYKSMAERQDEDFAALVKKLKALGKNNNNFEKLVKKHAEKYCWMLYGWTGPALETEYFRENILAALKDPKLLAGIEKRKTEHETNERKRKLLLEKLNGSDKKLVELLRKLLDAKAKRVDAHSLTYFLGDKILTEVGKRTFLSLNQLRVLPPEKLPKLFKKADPFSLNAEYDFVMYWFEDAKGVKKLVGEKGKKKFAYIAERLPKIKPTNTIKGEMAFMGKVKGKAKIILSQADFGKFKKGEVLVTRMTDPSYVPLMKISRAVVTDIGGITCHASIVSRELRKPCIIGTKIATKVLRDGDSVEVDADQGIIRKVK